MSCVTREYPPFGTPSTTSVIISQGLPGWLFCADQNYLSVGGERESLVQALSWRAALGQGPPRPCA